MLSKPASRSAFALLIFAIGIVTFADKYSVGELQPIAWAAAIVAITGMVLWILSKWQKYSA